MNDHPDRFSIFLEKTKQAGYISTACLKLFISA